jgi:hypothetical protein
VNEPTPVPSDVPERFQVRFEGKTLLGIYRVDRELAAGGMGSIYLAHDQNLGRRVVVKVPHGRFLAEPGFRTRFRREVAELVRLEHPHVVRILAQGEEGDVPYFVLQYLGGGSLEERIAKGPQPAGSALEWLTKVAETLDFVHAQGVVHRDVKPANILFDERGHVFLSDFGVVKALEGEATGAVTEAGAGVGSPLYMAPEQALGRDVDARSDQYALATTLYEALAGAPPYGRGSLVELVLAKDRTEAPPLRSVSPAVPEACAAAVHRGLRRDPAERFPSCAALAAAFRGGLEAATTPHVGVLTPATPVPAPATANATSPATPAAPAAAPRSRRLTLSVGLVPLVAILAVGFASGWFRSKAPDAAPERAAPEPEGAQQLIRVAAAGAEPRRLLRMRFTEGTTDRLRTTSSYDFSQQQEGSEAQEFHTRSEVVIGARVKAVDRDGGAWVQWTFDSAKALPREGRPEAEAQSNAYFERVGTVSGTGSLSARGVASDVVLSRAGPKEPGIDEMVSTFEAMVRGFAVLLPPTPVGVGAEWVVTGFEKYGDMTYESTRTCRLLEAIGDRLKIRIDTAYGGGKQGVPFQRSGDREWRLEKLSGSLVGDVVLDLTRPLAESFDTKMDLAIDALGEGPSGTARVRVTKAFSMTAKRE